MEGVAREDHVERRITVTGRVQGVGYRWFACETARTLGVAGWASNLPDGSVVLEAGATKTVMERFIALLHVGPPHALVTHIEVGARAAGDPLDASFTVLH